MSSRSLESYSQVCLIWVGAKLCRTLGPKLPIPGIHHPNPRQRGALSLFNQTPINLGGLQNKSVSVLFIFSRLQSFAFLTVVGFLSLKYALKLRM